MLLITLNETAFLFFQMKTMGLQGPIIQQGGMIPLAQPGIVPGNTAYLLISSKYSLLKTLPKCFIFWCL